MTNNPMVLFPLQAGGGSVQGALVYKDTVSSASDLPSSSEVQVGWLYIAGAAFLLNGEQIEIGDELYWNGTRWNIVQGNITVEPYWEVKSFRIRPSGNDSIIVSELYKNNSLYNGYVTLRVVDSQKWGRWDLPQRQCVNGDVTFYFDNTTNTIMSDPAVTDIVFFLIVDGKIIYSQGWTRNAASITSGEKGYANGDQVKTYVDNNGFNPSSMPLVTDPVTLNTPQADWNQNDSTAQDYIKNKPTIPEASDVWEFDVTITSLSTLSFIGVKKNNVTYSGTLKVGASNYFSNHSKKGSYNLGNVTITNGSGSLSVGSVFDSSVNSVTFKFYSSDKYVGSISFAKKADSITTNETGFTTGDQVYSYVSTQIGNIETLLVQI